MRHIQKGFTLVELVFVIVILGIVASIGSDIIAQVYESYLIQRAQYRTTTKTQLALQQIANRLRYAIPSTVYVKNGSGSYVPITTNTDENATVLLWVGSDADGYNAGTWHGFCDVNDSNASFIALPDANLTRANTIIRKLGSRDLNNSAIFFPYDKQEHNISSYQETNLTLSSQLASGKKIYERYKIAWTSYAIEINNNNLILHYNFAPVPGAGIPNSAQSSVLLRNVANFRFKYAAGAFRLKICQEETTGLNKTIHACKEKVVF